jgi:hypothetical protein
MNRTTVIAAAPSSLDAKRQSLLMRINLNDLCDNLGLAHSRLRRAVAERVFSPQAEQFTQMVLDFDQRVGEAGLQVASREMLMRHVQDVRVGGLEHVPADGAVIFAANHAGMSETLACFSAVPRADLKAVGNDRPFVRALPNVFSRLIAVPEEEGDRFAVVRQITRHLQAGGALFINPAGQIEPDPACMPGAVESLKTWSPSLGLFVKRVPAVRVVPTLVSGVILPSTLTHPLARVRRTQKDRARAASALQLLVHMRQRERTPLTPTVTFGRPLRGSELAKLGDANAIVGAITDEMARMMASAGLVGAEL